MMVKSNKDENKCPKCKTLSLHLISLTDDGVGPRMCRKCKRKYKLKHPEVDYRYTKYKRKGE